jgi:hypothetical protein
MNDKKIENGDIKRNQVHGLVICRCTISESKGYGKGSFCVECGRKTMEVETRECQYCKHSKKLIDGYICKKHLMSISANMLVSYDPKDGTCWEGR